MHLKVKDIAKLEVIFKMALGYETGDQVGQFMKNQR
jgi:catechol-2,3-dioxygenase